MDSIPAAVIGNATIDVICYPVDDVPRHHSLTFEQAAVAPGGCGSNTAIGVARSGVPVLLVACTGTDQAGDLALEYWRKAGIDTRFVRRIPGVQTGVSVGLVDSAAQPRFIHTTGANAQLSLADIQPQLLAECGVRGLHIAGFFLVRPLMDSAMAQKLAEARQLGMFTSLDVALSKHMRQPESLWACLPYLDAFQCNLREAQELTGIQDAEPAAAHFRQLGAGAVIIKLGEQGCWLDCPEFRGKIAAPQVDVVETTGAGDAFAAGCLAAILQGATLVEACQAGNRCGARIAAAFGAVAGWF